MDGILPILFFLILPNLLISQNSVTANWVDGVVELQSHQPTEDTKDLIQLGKAIGNSRVVGLGETTHGTHEIFTMKHRIIRYLIEEREFNIIAFESNKPETALINQYIQGGDGDPRQLLKGIYFWTWNTEEILDLINWIRAYNSTRSPKVQFLGIDMQYNKLAVKNLKEYFSTTPDVLKLLLQIETMYKENKRSKLNYEQLDALVASLTKKIDSQLSGMGSAEESIRIREDLKIIAQSAQLDKTQSTVFRDECMANYVKDYVDLSGKNKVIVWGHNMHISKDDFWKMGFHLKKHYRSDYYALGFALSSGTFTAKDYQNKIQTSHQLKENPKNSVEYKFAQLGIPLFFIDADAFKKDKWFAKKRKFRDIGAAIWGNEFIGMKLNDGYDGIVFISQSSASKLLD